MLETPDPKRSEVCFQIPSCSRGEEAASVDSMDGDLKILGREAQDGEIPRC